MSKLKFYLIFFAHFYIFSFGQESEEIYLIFNGIKDSCVYSPQRDGSNSKPYLYEPRFRLGCFTFCNQYFSIKPNTIIEEIKEKDIIQLNIVTIDYFLRKREQNEKTQLTNPNKLFKNIFVLVSNSNGSYFKIEVYWKEVYINSELKELEPIEN